jgi:undecaprenyl-diphosphatase
MSIPIIFGAGLLKIKHFHDGVTTPELLVGFVTAAVSGFLSIRFLLRLISKRDFTVFVWYRVVFAALILAVYFIRR